MKKITYVTLERTHDVTYLPNIEYNGFGTVSEYGSKIVWVLFVPRYAQQRGEVR